jgi:hypothetical protein
VIEGIYMLKITEIVQKYDTEAHNSYINVHLPNDNPFRQ